MLAGWLPRAGAFLALALLAATVLDRGAPSPSAEISRGSEEAFLEGLHPREIPPGGRPLRWTKARAVARFRHLPAQPARVQVRVRGHRGSVTVSAGGVLLGRLEPGTTSGEWALPGAPRREWDVMMEAEVFPVGGRRLGALLDRVGLDVAAAGWPEGGLQAQAILLAAVAAGAAALAGFQATGPLACAAVLLGVWMACLWPSGLVRSPYAWTLTVQLAASALLAAAVARGGKRKEERRALFAGVACLLVVFPCLATSPLMVVSDAVFHANNLARVAGGQWLLTSSTQHDPPFRFPYGVAFYALLLPLARLGVEPVTLVRWGAALAVAAGSVAFVRGVSRRGGSGAWTAAWLVLLPIAFDVHSYGNLANAFAQGLTLVLLAWWMGERRGGWPVGAALAAGASLAHFSAFVALGAFVLAVASERPPDAASRAGGRALACGWAVAAGYYALFLPLVASQLGRLGEGGQAGGAGGLLAAASAQPLAAWRQWGGPALLAIVLGRLGAARAEWGRGLRALWMAGGGLLLLAVLSPLEVRYLYALTPAAALASAEGQARLWRRGGAAAGAAGVLVLAQMAVAVPGWADAIAFRYR